MILSEFIKKLQQLDQSLPVAVRDADTGWCAPVIGVSVGSLDDEPITTYVMIEPCDYPDMKGDFK